MQYATRTPVCWMLTALALVCATSLPLRALAAEAPTVVVPQSPAQAHAANPTTAAPADALADTPTDAPAYRPAGTSLEPPPEPPADEPLPEVEIVGERPGPGLWRVTNGDRSLYILGTLRPLPRRMTWRSREVDEVLARAQLLIPESADVDADVGLFKAVKLYAQWRRIRKNADGARLEEVLPPALYARFESLRERHAPRSRDMLKLRPVLAAATLWREALDGQSLELRIDVEKQIRKRARKLDVEIAKPTVQVDDPQGLLNELDAIPRDAEIACMEVTLDRLETDLANARALADAWATGDVDLIRTRQVWLGQQACFESLISGSRLDSVRREFDAAWFDAVVGALESRQVALAIAPMSTLLRPDGVLAQLERRGYTVEAP